MTKLTNIIFLDIDGVLCTMCACFAAVDIGISSYLDSVACQLVKKLCQYNKAQLVLSRSWRLTYDRIAMRAILNAECQSLGDFILAYAKWWMTQVFVYSDDNYVSS